MKNLLEKKTIKFKHLLIFLFTQVFILLTINLHIIYKKGYENRVGSFLEKNNLIKTHELLKDSNGNNCFENIEGCKFNTQSNKKIYIIGDSHAGSLIYDLKNKTINKKFQFINFTISGCLYFPEFNLLSREPGIINQECNSKYFKKISNILLNENNSTVIFFGRYPLYLSNYFFDNKEGGVESGRWHVKFEPVGKYASIKDSFYHEVLRSIKKK